MDGFGASVLREETLAMTDVDIVTTHHYPGGGSKSFSDVIRANAARAKGIKPYIIGEFGFVPTAKMADTLQTIRDTGISGGMLWSLRFRDRDGGFYWHTESGSGGNVYKAFHWPASPIADAYDELNLMSIVRTNAFAIRGLPVPPVAVPAPPTLLPIKDAAAISWQGSVGASGYQVERAPAADGPWQIIATNVDEAFTQYQPQFADENVSIGSPVYYRVRAGNESGLSEPSNVAGPVDVRNVTLIDELADFSKVYRKNGDWKIASSECRSAREDAHRAAGSAGSELIYQLPSDIQSFRVFAFFPKSKNDPKFSLSEDGQIFDDITAQQQQPPRGSSDYDYWKPVEFHQAGRPAGRFLRLKLTGETQIGRVEISRKLSSP